MFDEVTTSPKCTRSVSQGQQSSEVEGLCFARYLIYVWMPVLVVLGLGYRAVDSGEEGGLGEVHQSRVQTKRLSNNCLDSPSDISEKQTNMSD